VRRNLTPVFFLLPAFAIILGLKLYPLIYGIELSLRRYALYDPASVNSWYGLGNYVDALSDWKLGVALENTAIYTVIAVGVNLAAGLAVASLLYREFRGRGTLTTMFAIPYMLSSIVAGYLWKFMLQQPTGIANYVLQSLGLLKLFNISAIFWLSDPVFARISVAMVEIWQTTPFVVLIFLAALQSLPREPFDSAIVDGASRWQIFRHVTLPMLSPVIAIVLLTRIVGVLRIFDQIYALTNGGPGVLTESLSTYIYKVGFSYLEISRATTYGMLTLALDLPFIFIFARWMLKSAAS
jgi:multiple sugar transport system permease protein